MEEVKAGLGVLWSSASLAWSSREVSSLLGDDPVTTVTESGLPWASAGRLLLAAAWAPETREVAREVAQKLRGVDTASELDGGGVDAWWSTVVDAVAPQSPPEGSILGEAVRRLVERVEAPVPVEYPREELLQGIIPLWADRLRRVVDREQCGAETIHEVEFLVRDDAPRREPVFPQWSTLPLTHRGSDSAGGLPVSNTSGVKGPGPGGRKSAMATGDFNQAVATGLRDPAYLQEKIRKARPRTMQMMEDAEAVSMMDPDSHAAREQARREEMERRRERDREREQEREARRKREEEERETRKRKEEEAREARKRKEQEMEAQRKEKAEARARERAARLQQERRTPTPDHEGSETKLDEGNGVGKAATVKTSSASPTARGRASPNSSSRSAAIPKAKSMPSTPNKRKRRIVDSDSDAEEEALFASVEDDGESDYKLASPREIVETSPGRRTTRSSLKESSAPQTIHNPPEVTLPSKARGRTTKREKRVEKRTRQVEKKLGGGNSAPKPTKAPPSEPVPNAGCTSNDVFLPSNIRSTLGVETNALTPESANILKLFFESNQKRALLFTEKDVIEILLNKRQLEPGEKYRSSVESLYFEMKADGAWRKIRRARKIK